MTSASRIASVQSGYEQHPAVIEARRLIEQKRPKGNGRDPQPVQDYLPGVAEYTPTIRFNPAIGLASLPSFEHVRPGLGGAWRAWVLARSLDETGSGLRKDE